MGNKVVCLSKRRLASTCVNREKLDESIRDRVRIFEEKHPKVLDQDEDDDLKSFFDGFDGFIPKSLPATPSADRRGFIWQDN